MKKHLIGLVVALLIFAGAAQAQTVTPPGIPVPQAVSIGAKDLFLDVVGGQPSANSQYVAAGQISGVEGYSLQVPVTAFAITVPNGASLLYLNPAGTLATGALTLMAAPSDGQKSCVEDSQTQTAVTVAANTGQALASYGLGAVTALTANTRYCWLYVASQAAWVRTQ